MLLSDSITDFDDSEKGKLLKSPSTVYVPPHARNRKIENETSAQTNVKLESSFSKLNITSKTQTGGSFNLSMHGLVI